MLREKFNIAMLYLQLTGKLLRPRIICITRMQSNSNKSGKTNSSARRARLFEWFYIWIFSLLYFIKLRNSPTYYTNVFRISTSWEDSVRIIKINSLIVYMTTLRCLNILTRTHILLNFLIWKYCLKSHSVEFLIFWLKTHLYFNTTQGVKNMNWLWRQSFVHV